MSRGDPATRERILRAARELLEDIGTAVTMGRVAQRAGVSRQALYLHFADRTDLILEVSRLVDVSSRTPERQSRVDEAPTARDALREAIALQAAIKPELHAAATALDVLRRTDPAVEAAWQEREQARLARCEAVVARLRDEDLLAAHLDAGTAAQLLWAITSQRVWEYLAVDRGWSTQRYREHLTQLLEASLLVDRRVQSSGS